VISKSRGQVQEKGSPIYHYIPNSKLNWYPHVAIDENGYRNKTKNQLSVDSVFLGDSIVFAKRSKKDLADLSRDNNISALNLAMSGYSPLHYRDVYKKYIVDRKISHKKVIVNIFVGNDFDDSLRYPWEIKINPKGNPSFPWIINLLVGVLENRKGVKQYNVQLKESKHKVKLPYRKINIRYLWWPTLPDKEKWEKTSSALYDIVSYARSMNAEPVFVVIPSPASVYGLSLYKDFKRYTDVHIDVVKMFRKEFKSENVKIIDTLNSLAAAVEEQFLYVDESDCHFNTHGTKVLYSIINKNM